MLSQPLNRRSMLRALAAAALVLGQRSPALAKAASTWSFYVRATQVTWPQLLPFSLPGDLYWGSWSKSSLDPIPSTLRAFEIHDYSDLSSKSDTSLAKYCAVYLDGEYKIFSKAFAEAPEIRTFIDGYNSRNPATPLRFHAYYHTKIIDDYPTIVDYPDSTSVGFSHWQSSPQNFVAKALPYVTSIRAAGRFPAARLTDYVTVDGVKQTLAASDLAAQISAAIDTSSAGLGVTIIEGFYFNDDATALVAALPLVPR